MVRGGAKGGKRRELEWPRRMGPLAVKLSSLWHSSPPGLTAHVIAPSLSNASPMRLQARVLHIERKRKRGQAERKRLTTTRKTLNRRENQGAQRGLKERKSTA